MIHVFLATFQTNLGNLMLNRRAATNLEGGWWRTIVSASTTHCNGSSVILKAEQV